MKNPHKEDFWKRKAAVIKALAHPSRLSMLEAMASGEKCVCELQALIGDDISTISKHLALMKRAGLVSDRREGQRIYYSLRCPCIIRFTDTIDRVLKLQDEE